MVSRSARVALAALGGVAAAGSLVGCGNPKGPVATPSPTPPCPATNLHDGTFTGAAATTPRGPLQVEIEVTDGRISDIRVPVYPTDVPMSETINKDAVPTLIERGLAAQCAVVDTVSGATYTSQGYRQSLQSAIDKAAG